MFIVSALCLIVALWVDVSSKDSYFFFFRKPRTKVPGLCWKPAHDPISLRTIVSGAESETQREGGLLVSVVGMNRRAVDVPSRIAPHNA